MQGTQVRSLVRELDPICCNEDQRSCVPQLGPGTVRYMWGCRGWLAALTWVSVSREMVGFPAPIR